MATTAEVEQGERRAEKNAQPARKRRRHQRGLLAVGLFKLFKAIFFGGLGIGALKLLHQNLGDLVMRVTSMVPLDPEGRIVSLLMDRADLIGNHQLRQVSAFSLAYSAICLVEGCGLLAEKVWAEYITVTLTLIALPWEIYGLVRGPNAFHWALLAINLAILFYLLWVIRKRRVQMREDAAGS